MSIDQQFVEFVVKSLVSKPDEVQVKRTIDEKGVLLELTVDPEDLGRVIGKRGATAQSIRTLLRALGTKNDARYNLKIVDNGPGKAGKSEEKKSEGLWGEDSGADSSDPGPDNEAEEAIAETASNIEDEGNTDGDDEQDEAEENDSFSRTRKELADLDDLDV
ncbi:MAG TPA: KH domain-containing protein [Candidatus Saccharimonadales bacterium]|nr:KH domain-containing protein [Candidatus Saccharimonadales bacterium]